MDETYFSFLSVDTVLFASYAENEGGIRMKLDMHSILPGQNELMLARTLCLPSFGDTVDVQLITIYGNWPGSQAKADIPFGVPIHDALISIDITADIDGMEMPNLYSYLVHRSTLLKYSEVHSTEPIEWEDWGPHQCRLISYPGFAGGGCAYGNRYVDSVPFGPPGGDAELVPCQVRVRDFNQLALSRVQVQGGQPSLEPGLELVTEPTTVVDEIFFPMGPVTTSLPYIQTLVTPIGGVMHTITQNLTLWLDHENILVVEVGASL